MKNSLRWWILLLYVIASQTAAPCENDVRVHLKQDRRLPPPFLNLVRKTPIYVDKTRFIEYALRKWLGRFVILVAPPGWGKSTLFNMLQFFFEAELDRRHQAIPPNRTSSYQFFAHGQLDSNVFIDPPLISHCVDLIAQHVARTPVIRLNFSNMIEWREITTYDEFLGRFKNFLLKQLGDRHRPAMKTLCSEGRNLIGQRVPATQLYDLCNNFENDMLNEIELRHYASKWANWLKIYYGKSPVILVDSYDTIFNALYFITTFWYPLDHQTDDSLPTRIVDFFTDFLHITYRNSDSLFTLLSGVLAIDIGRGNATCSHYSVVNHQHEDVYRYLGITEQEADKVFHHTGFNVHQIQKAKLQLGGYLVEWKPNVTLLNPLFVREYKVYFETKITSPDRNLETLRSMIWLNPPVKSKKEESVLQIDFSYLHTSIMQPGESESLHVKKYFTQWLLDKRIPSCNPNHRRLLSCDQLQSMNDREDDEFAALLYSTELLWSLGYLTYDHDQDRFNIPNEECRNTLHEALFGRNFIRTSSDASKVLIELLENSNRTPDVFVKKYVESLYWSYERKTYDEIEDFCMVALYEILRRASAVHGYQCTADMNVTDETAQQKPSWGPYMAIHNDRYGAVIKLNYHAEDANLSAVVNSFRRAYPHVKTLRTIIINLFPNQYSYTPTANYLDEFYYNPIYSEGTSPFYRRSSPPYSSFT